MIIKNYNTEIVDPEWGEIFHQHIMPKTLWFTSLCSIPIRKTYEDP